PTADSSLASMTGGVACGGSLASPLAIRPALTLGPAEAESRFVVAVCVSGTVPGVSEEPSCSSENIFHLVSSRTRRLTSWETLFRSEEHTSELQSRGHLVCRLLLEKKKKNVELSIQKTEK